MKSRLPVKQILHRLFLLVSAIVVLHSVASILIINGVFRFGSLLYFTLLSNILLAIIFTTIAFLPSTLKFRSYLSFTALVCISITGIVYNFVLVPSGWGIPVTDGWANFVTHLLSMALAFVNYLVFEEKGKLTFRHVLVAIVPPFSYWVIFMIISIYPYPFMNPLMIGWLMVFVWFFIIVLIIAGLAFLLVFLDKRPKLLVASSLLFVVIICCAVIFLRPQPPIVQWSRLMDNALEAREDVRVEFTVRRARTYTIESGYMLSEGIITAFLIIDDNGDVLFHSIGEELMSIPISEINLGRGHFSASWTYLTSYDDVLSFFALMGLGEVTPQESDYFLEVFGRDEIIADSYVYIWIR